METVIGTIDKGFFYVTEVDTNGASILMTCLDAMIAFDQDYSNVTQTYPATLQSIVTNICMACGVPYPQTSFRNSTFTVPARPDDAALTCRDMLSAVCQIAASWGKIDRSGNFVIDFYDSSFTQRPEKIDGDLDGGSFWTDIDSADGGSFWNVS